MNHPYQTIRTLRWQQYALKNCSTTSSNSSNNISNTLKVIANSNRFISTRAALEILELPPNVGRLTPKELRRAYIEAAKKHHPDSQQYHTRAATTKPKNTNSIKDQKIDVAKQFRLVTEAFELLQEQQQKRNNPYGSHFGQANHENDDKDDGDDDWGISAIEEAEFRRACTDILGLDAEIVEESKQCPAFRHWLQGKTDGAMYWQMFFLKYGGLAPMLRPKKHRPVALINAGEIGRRRRR